VDTVEPFWCEELGRFLKVIPNEEADRICKDVQLYYKFPHGQWKVDRSVEDYRHPIVNRPTTYDRCLHAIEVHLDKPEYEPEHVKCGPEQRSCDHDE